MSPPARVIPTWTEPAVAAASAVIGGPLGRHAVVGRSRFWTPLRVVLLGSILVLAMGWLGKAPCLQQTPDGNGGLALDWQNGRQYVAMCYTDIVTLYGDHRLAQGGLPYRENWTDPQPDGGSAAVNPHYMDYPVFTGFFLWEMARVAVRYEAVSATSSWLPTGLPEVLFFDVTAVFLAIAWLCVVWAVRRLRPVRPWDAALVALSPLVLVHVFTGLDALAVAASTVALYAFSRGRSTVAGILLGLGVAAKLYVVVLLVPLILLGLRRGGSPHRELLPAAVLTWLIINTPVIVFFTPGWQEFFRVGIGSGAEPDSLYYVVSYFTGWLGFDGTLAPGAVPWRLNLVVLGLLLAAAVGLFVLVRIAPQPPRLASLCFLAVAAVLVVNKAWSPQFSLWLVPLAVLALPRWRLLFAWMTADALVWVPRMFFYLGTDNKGLPADYFLAFVLVRDALIVLIMVEVVRSILRPADDPVRRLGADDPEWPEEPAAEEPAPEKSGEAAPEDSSARTEPATKSPAE